MGMPYIRILDLARAAEEAGFEAFFRSDHWRPMMGPDVAATDAWTTLGGLARETTRIRLGTLVSPITFRGPYEIAKIVATVDEMSGGRVELGLGAGWLEREHEPLGIPLPALRERLGRLEEQLTVVRALWTQPVVDFSGDWYRLQGAALEPKPVQQPSPPIVVGGTGRPRSLAIAARLADEYNFDDLEPAAIDAALPGVRAACEAAGRDPSSLVVSAMIDWPAGSRREQHARIERFANTGVERLFLDVHDGMLGVDEVVRFGREVIALHP
jgi:F420-dependent oxidoreductase-like protein